MSDIVAPDDVAVGRVQEWNTKATKVQVALRGPGRMAFRMSQNILRAQAELLRFDYAQQRAVDEQSLIGWPIVGWQFLDGVTPQPSQTDTFSIRDNRPASLFKAAVDASLLDLRFGFHVLEWIILREESIKLWRQPLGNPPEIDSEWSADGNSNR